MNLGNNIRSLRQRQSLTQEQVASRLGVSYQAVSKWETGANTPDISLLPSIAALFGVTIDALFSDEIAACPDLLPPFEDDGVIRIIQMRGHQVLKVTPRPSPNDPAIEIAFPRNCNDQTQYFKVEVYGHVISDSSINGDVVCHQSIQCSMINGDVKAQGDITAHEVTDSGSIVCHSIRNCYSLQANRIDCSGNISAANLTCSQIVSR